jgi:hypothetical protein
MNREDLEFRYGPALAQQIAEEIEKADAASASCYVKGAGAAEATFDFQESVRAMNDNERLTVEVLILYVARRLNLSSDMIRDIICAEFQVISFMGMAPDHYRNAMDFLMRMAGIEEDQWVEDG